MLKLFETKKFLGIGLCLLVVVATIFTLLLTTNQSSKGETPKDDLIFNEEGESPIKLQMRKANNVLTQAANTYVVNATVSPSEAVNRKLTWTMAWSTTYNATISDYVTMVVSEDTFSVTLTYVKAFEKQIKLTATSVATPSVKATCTLDCYERPEYKMEGAQAYITGIDEPNNPTFSGTTFTFTQFKNVSLKACSFEFVDDVSYIGTIKPSTVNAKYSIGFSESVSTILTNNSIAFKTRIDPSTYTGDGTSIYNMICALITEFSTTAPTEQRFAEVITLLSGVDHWFDYVVALAASNNGSAIYQEIHTYALKGFSETANYYNTIKSIVLDKTGIIM